LGPAHARKALPAKRIGQVAPMGENARGFSPCRDADLPRSRTVPLVPFAASCGSLAGRPGGPPMFWAALTRFGESGILLPVGIALALWLTTAAGRLRPAFECLVPLGVAVLVTLLSKIAFIGFGIGIAALDFTGFSGHAMFAAAVYPILAYSLLGRARTPGLVAGVAAGYAFALLLAVSRVVVGAHSGSEAASGFLLGAVASGLSLHQLGRPPQRAAPAVLLASLMAWLMVTPQVPPLVASHSLVTRLALQVSGRQTPYTRADLHREERLERRWQREIGRQHTLSAASDAVLGGPGPAGQSHSRARVRVSAVTQRVAVGPSGAWITPSLASRSICSALKPLASSTSRVCSPSSGPSHSTPPGLAESLGTMPGMRIAAPSARVASSSISRAWYCGSAAMSAML
jgi:membrane-associated phospholipid phosphatase